MYTEQIKEGDDYDVLKKCIQVSIFDHVYFKEDDRCYRRITFRDDQMKKEYTDLSGITSGEYVENFCVIVPEVG